MPMVISLCAFTKDDDVAAERRKVTELQELDDKAVVIKNLNKVMFLKCSKICRYVPYIYSLPFQIS